jgi:hypothetical protein
LYDPSKEEFWDHDFTVVSTHELAHRIDSLFVSSMKDLDFCEIIQKSKNAITADPGKFITHCEQNDMYGFLSDICSAISDGEYDFPTGHPAEYWKIPGTKSREVFANLFSLESFHDRKSLGFIRDNFPDLLKVYQKNGLRGELNVCCPMRYGDFANERGSRFKRRIYGKTQRTVHLLQLC